MRGDGSSAVKTTKHNGKLSRRFDMSWMVTRFQKSKLHRRCNTQNVQRTRSLQRGTENEVRKPRSPPPKPPLPSPLCLRCQPSICLSINTRLLFLHFQRLLVCHENTKTSMTAPILAVKGRCSWEWSGTSFTMSIYIGQADGITYQ